MRTIFFMSDHLIYIIVKSLIYYYVEDNIHYTYFIICESFNRNGLTLKIMSSFCNRCYSSKSEWRKMNYLENTIVSFVILILAIWDRKGRAVSIDNMYFNMFTFIMWFLKIGNKIFTAFFVFQDAQYMLSEWDNLDWCRSSLFPP